MANTEPTPNSDDELPDSPGKKDERLDFASAAESAVRRRKQVLLVDDSLVIQRLIQFRLGVDGFEVAIANNGREALDKIEEIRPDVILLDVDMPVMNGLETCRHLKERADTRLIPIIFLTSQGKTDDKVKGLDLGAIDYVTKPFDPIELRARVRSAYRTKYLMELLEQKAQIDGMTGLFNREYFLSRLQQEIERANRYAAHVCLILADIDHFKKINDNYGHLFGDVVLTEVAELLKNTARTADIVTRYGGEEFAVILTEQDSIGGRVYADRCLSLVREMEPKFDDRLVTCTISIGIASTMEVGFDSSAKLIAAADTALYAAKNAGRDQLMIFESEMTPRQKPSHEQEAP